MSFARDARGRIRWTRLRRLSQVTVLLFFVLLPVTYIWGQVTVLGSLASLRLGMVSLVDPAAGLSSAVAALEMSWTLVSGLVLPVLMALVLGPVFCSWVCPWGLLSEPMDRLRRSRAAERSPRWVASLRWAALGAVLILSLATGIPLAAVLSAPRLLTVLPSELIFLGGGSVATLGLLSLILLLEILLPRRLWCRALCPVGSVLVLLKTRFTLGIGWSVPSCDPAACGVHCVATCPWHLDPRAPEPFDGCTNCCRCVEGCPAELNPALTLIFRGSRTGSA